MRRVLKVSINQVPVAFPPYQLYAGHVHDLDASLPVPVPLFHFMTPAEPEPGDALLEVARHMGWAWAVFDERVCDPGPRRVEVWA